MKCVFCLENGGLQPQQILERGEHYYIGAPRGQLVEGYLVVSPYRCQGALSQSAPESFAELNSFVERISHFYRAAYGIPRGVFYEQGRAGGGERIDPVGGFPLHAHLCALPVMLDLHCLVESDFQGHDVRAFQDLPELVGQQPYLYLDAMSCGRPRRCVYLGGDSRARRRLEVLRFKPMVAASLGMPERADWRLFPGDRELKLLIAKYAAMTEHGNPRAWMGCPVPGPS